MLPSKARNSIGSASWPTKFHLFLIIILLYYQSVRAIAGHQDTSASSSVEGRFEAEAQDTSMARNDDLFSNSYELKRSQSFFGTNNDNSNKTSSGTSWPEAAHEINIAPPAVFAITKTGDQSEDEDELRSLQQLVGSPVLVNGHQAAARQLASNIIMGKMRIARNLQAASNAVVGQRTTSILRIHVTAIYVDKSEFPLSKLLFKLTLRLALEEVANKLRAIYLEQRQQRQEEQQQQVQSQVQVKFSMSIRDANTCSRQYASAIAAEEYYTKKARLFIVSGCDEAIRSVSQLASSWRVPIMTAAGFSVDLNDKTVYRTLVRVAFSLKAAVEFLFKIMKSFQWRKINLIVDESDPNSLALKGSIERHAADFATMGSIQINLNVISIDLQMLINQQLQQSNDSMRQTTFATDSPTNSKLNNDNDNNDHKQINATAGSDVTPPSASSSIASDDKWPNEQTDKVIQAALKQSSLFSRVNVLLIPQQYLRKFMLSAYDQNMANGLYTFINMPLLLMANDEQVQDSSNQMTASRNYNYNSSTATPTNKQQQQHQQPSYLAATGENVFMWRSLRSSRNSHAKQAFESLMSIFLKTPTSKAHVYFADKLINMANSDYGTTTTTSPSTSLSSDPAASIGQKLHFPPQTNNKVQLNINPYSASFYDCLHIYAQALNESLYISLKNANLTTLTRLSKLTELHSRVSELMRNKRYDNMITGTVKLNSNGDREVDFTLDDMSQITGKFNPVIIYRADSREIERLGRIHWSSDSQVGPTSDSVDCNLIGTCASKPRTRLIIAILLMAVPLVIVFGVAFYFIQNKISLEYKLVDHWWRIHMNEIELIATRRKQNNDGTLVTLSQVGSGPAGGGSSVSLSSHRQLQPISNKCQSIAGGSLATPDNCNMTTVTKATHTTTMASSLDVCYGNISLANYKLARVALKPINGFHSSRKLMIELRTIKDINHVNLCRFIGIIVDEGSMALVAEFCPKGSLREFFYNESMVIDWTFKYSIINDIIAGLLYLHSSPLNFHGRLKSSNCLVSARFVIKLSDYGPHSLYERIDSDEQDEQVQIKKKILLAPEHMKSKNSTSSSKLGSQKGDIYSFGLILYEIITNKLPFFDQENNDYIMPLKSLYKELKANGITEKTGPDLSVVDSGCEVNIQPLVDLMESCWHYDPSKRPSSMVVGTAIKKITKGITSKKLLDNLTTRMEQYTNNLESLVEDKLAALVEEKLKTEELLYQFVPRSIALALKEGQTVEPEAFECVTVFYSDIVGFTSLSSESTPMEVVDLLSDLYLCFDETLEQHDIFKVDTIGDAYIVASGLPIRNDDKHVIEIACAALELRDRLAKFRIPHKPGRALEMRVGIHSGPCIAGIVGGLNMPKYCVFGDTLTIGKFMESTGLPMKIHVTEESRKLLAGNPGFTIEPRTPRIVRDGLPFQTYWLEKQ